MWSTKLIAIDGSVNMYMLKIEVNIMLLNDQNRMIIWLSQLTDQYEGMAKCPPLKCVQDTTGKLVNSQKKLQHIEYHFTFKRISCLIYFSVETSPIAFPHDYTCPHNVYARMTY